MKIIVLGPAGKMGKAMVDCAHNHPEIELAGAVGPAGRSYDPFDYYHWSYGRNRQSILWHAVSQRNLSGLVYWRYVYRLYHAASER